MVFAVIGGDRRQAELARLLVDSGHKVRLFGLGTQFQAVLGATGARAIAGEPATREGAEAAGERAIAGESAALENAGEPATREGAEAAGERAIVGATEAATVEEAARGADCVVLPMPVSANGGQLNAPMLKTAPEIGAVLAALPQDCVIVGGRVDARTAAEAAARGKRVVDVLQNEALAVGNAVATAEGAVEILLRETPFTLWRSRVLVLGYGRIGKLLCPRLAAFGARLSAAARRESDRVRIDASGFEPLDIGALEGRLGKFDILVNTVPALVLPEALLREVKPEALLLELASAPGGLDISAAERLGLRVVRAPGLPGKTAPKRAAALLMDCIFGILEEEHGKA